MTQYVYVNCPQCSTPNDTRSGLALPESIDCRSCHLEFTAAWVRA